jgi:hypothetical protein
MRKLMVYFVLCLSMLCSAVIAQTPAAGAVAPSLQFNWVAPTQRENGAALTTAELGGYELRYRLKTANNYSYVAIPSGTATSYVLAGVAAGEYEYQLAVYDTNGLYSGWVAIVPAVAATPKPVTNATAKRLGVDVKAACVSPGCRVAERGEYK